MKNLIKKGTICLLIITLVACFVYGLTSVAIITLSSNQNVSGNLLLNATTDAGAMNATFYFYNYASGTLIYNITIVNDTAADTEFNVTINTSLVLTDGVYNLTVNATNSSGTIVTNTSVNTLTIDNNAPVVTLVNASFNTTDTTPRVTFNYTDAVVATASCTLYMNSTAYNTSTVSNATNTELIVNATLSDGTYSASVYCSDSINTGNSSSIIITKDATTPAVSTFTSPTDGTFYTNSTSTVLLNVSITDATIGISAVLFNVSNGTNSFTLTASNVGDYWNATLNFTLLSLADANHTITVLANDTLNNLNNSVTVNIVYDTVNPVINSVAASSVTSTGATLTVNVTDETAGIANCTYSSPSTGTLTLSSGLYSSSLSSLTASTGYTINVTCTDNAGNTANNATVTFTTSAAASTSSSSSSSGGGGSATSQVPGQFSKVVWASITKGETSTVEVDGSEVGITEVEFSTTKNLWGVWMKVEKKDNLPSTVKSFDKKTYKFIEITKGLTFNDEYFVNPKIHFKVLKSWLTDNGLGKNNVALFRYHDDNWNELTTTVGEDDGTYIYYTADTPGFSYFLIGQNSEAILTEEVEEVVEEVPTEVKEVIVDEPSEWAEEDLGLQSEEAEKKSTWPWVLLVISIIVVAASIYWFRMKNK
ncbi:MAG: PGF-pre-PGF domain-containing protein [Nanoarchaeota archaeon]